MVAGRSTTPGSRSPTSTACSRNIGAGLGAVDGAGRVPRHPAPLDRLHPDRRLELRDPRRARAAAIALGLCDVAVRRLRGHAPVGPQARAAAATAAARRWASRRRPSGSCPTACACRSARTRSPPAATWPSSAPPPSSSPRSRSSTREWAAMNPRARLQDPITVDDVLASPIEASPLHKLDCCLVTDGAGAVVLTSAERARDLAQAAGARARRRHLPHPLDDQPDARPHHHRRARCRAPKAFAIAGLAPVRRRRGAAVRLVHDHRAARCSRTSASARRARAARSSPTGRSGPAARCPTNTNGGGLAYTHPGQFGMFLLVEAVRQLRGECGPRQVAGAEVAVAHGSGGVLSAMSTVVLGTEATA